MIRRIALLIVTVLTLAGCGAPALVQTESGASPVASPSPDTADNRAAIRVQDRMGRTLTFDQPPERVVCLYNSCYGMMATVGVKPVAQSVNPEMLSDPIYFDGAGTDIKTLRYTDSVDAEDVASVQPDLIIAYGEEEAQALGSIAPVYLEGDVNDLESLFAEVRRYGTILGREAEAEAAIQSFQERLNAYVERAPKNVSVLKLGAQSAQQFSVGTRNDPICQILNLVAQCDWPDPTGATASWSYETSLEGVLDLDPDVIILNNWSEGSDAALSDQQLRAALEQNPLWNELKAVRNGRVLSTPGYNNPIASSIPAATKFLDTYMPLIYPDVFPAPLTDQDMQSNGSTTPTEAGDRITVTDGSGISLTFNSPPERVVCLDNKCVEELAFLGVKPVGVGAIYNYNIAIDPYNFGEEAKSFVQIPSDPEVDFEKLAELQPDLVVGWEELRPSLQGIAPVFVLHYQGDSIEEMLKDTRTLAQIFGIEEVAEARIQQALDRLNAYAARSPRNKSLFITGGVDNGEFFAYDSREFWPCGLIEMIAQCAYPASAGGNITTEGLLSIDPDVIVIEEYEPEKGTVAAKVKQLEQTDPLWRELSAYQNDQIFVVPRTRARFTSIQSIQSVLDTLMALIYPDVFPEPLTDDQVREAIGR
jgi:iron complex transport system substrate-binding protein